VDTSKNLSLYAEDSLFVRPDLALIAGVQYLNASRDRRDRFLSNGDQSGRKTFDLWSPRFGVLWDAAPDAQLFANVSRSAEVPSYDANVITAPGGLQPQRATTFEIGTRGKRSGIGWDVSLYRSQIRDELQCLTTGPFAACSIINAGRTSRSPPPTRTATSTSTVTPITGTTNCQAFPATSCAPKRSTGIQAASMPARM
jgi:iron complex outermembrane receptor protein